MRAEITGISEKDGYANGFLINEGDKVRKSVIGLTGDFTEFPGETLPGYQPGNFTADNGELEAFFFAVQIKEIPE